MLAILKKLGINTMLLYRTASLADARTHALSRNGIWLVVMGDDERYWVVSAREAGVLRKAGYETI